MLLFDGVGVVLGGGDYVFRCSIHDIFVIFMYFVVFLWYVFGGFKKFSDLYWELWVIADPRRNSRKSETGFGLGLKLCGDRDVVGGGGKG